VDSWRWKLSHNNNNNNNNSNNSDDVTAILFINDIGIGSRNAGQIGIPYNM